MKTRFTIGAIPWTSGGPETLPKLARPRKQFVELFADYSPKPAKTISGTYGYPSYEMDLPADTPEFERLLKQLDAAVKKCKPKAAVVLQCQAPDAKEVNRARLLLPYYFADFVDEGSRRDLLNPEMVLCQECKYPNLKKLPDPLLVNNSVLRKYDVFHTSVSMLVVRPAVLELLKKRVGNQIQFGDVAIAGAKGKPKAADRLYWVRPKTQTGPRSPPASENSPIGSACSTMS